jgi:hypothetical protein
LAIHTNAGQIASGRGFGLGKGGSSEAEEQAR